MYLTQACCWRTHPCRGRSEPVTVSTPLSMLTLSLSLGSRENTEHYGILRTYGGEGASPIFPLSLCGENFSTCWLLTADESRVGGSTHVMPQRIEPAVSLRSGPGGQTCTSGETYWSTKVPLGVPPASSRGLELKCYLLLTASVMRKADLKREHDRYFCSLSLTWMKTHTGMESNNPVERRQSTSICLIIQLRDGLCVPHFLMGILPSWLDFLHVSGAMKLGWVMTLIPAWLSLSNKSCQVS